MRTGVHVVFALAGFVGCCAVLETCFEPPGLVSEKLALLRERSEHVTTLFLGPSYVQVGVSSGVFDRVMKAHGRRGESFKFGLAGLRSYEQRSVLERILELNLPRLEWIVVDVTLDPELQEPRLEEQNRFTQRAIDWHTWENFLALSRFYAGWKSKSLRSRGESMAVHASHLAMNYSNVGGGIRLLEGQTSLRAPLERLPPRAEDRSSRAAAVRKEAKRKTARRRKHDAGIDPKGKAGRTYLWLVRKLRKWKKSARAARRYPDLPYLVELRDKARAAGKRALFVLSPVVYRRMPPVQSRQGDDPVVVFDFNDPDAFEALYAPKARKDRNHLNRRGAKIFSRLLAEHLVAYEGEKGE